MALFSRGNDRASILKRLDSKSYRNKQEKLELLRALGEMGDVRADDLFRFLMAGDSDLNRFAVERLPSCRDRNLVGRLLDALQKAPRGRWRSLISAIHRIGSPRLGDRLAQLLRSDRLEARTAALEVLAADRKWKDHLHLLKGALRDRDDAIRMRAVFILSNDAHDGAIRRLLRDLLQATDEPARHAAIAVLARNPGVDVIEDFFDLLPNEPPKIQGQMIDGLRHMLAKLDSVPERVLERLLPLVAAEDRFIRESAAQLLAALPDSLSVLRRFMHYAKGMAFWLRDRAFNAIATVANDIVDAILTLLEDGDVDVVVGAINMASNSQDPRLFDALQELLGRDLDWWVKIPALETLATFRHPGVAKVLLGFLGEEDLRPAAMAALGRRAEPDALPHLIELTGHESRTTRRLALAALESYKEPRLLGPLERVARTDPDHECRLRALEMLDLLGPEGVATAASIRDESAREEDPKGVVGLTMLKDEPD